MMKSSSQMNLNLFINPGGNHESGWRYSGSDPSRLLDIDYYSAIVRKAEAAKIDAIFLADGPTLSEDIKFATRFRMEPLTWLSAFAAITEKIGLIGTASTTYTEPYNLARLFASLDHISKGRSGWNIVTTLAPQAAQNFGISSHPPPAERYERAREFVEIVQKLWDSWEDEAVIADQKTGIFADTSKIHDLNFKGKFTSVKGALNVQRSPQGRPVFIQAGASNDGRAFAADFAEAIFTTHQTLESAQSFYSDIKGRAVAAGRDPTQIKILPGLSTFVGSTTAEAQRLLQEFDELTHPDHALSLLNRFTGIDFKGYDLDETFPRELIDVHGGKAITTNLKVLTEIVERENPTIRQLMNRIARARGHWVFAGTPEEIADQMQQWFEGEAADGFNLMPAFLSGGFDSFADEVVPILQRRGLFRLDYTGSTLREHYGLSRPKSQYTVGIDD